VRLSQKCARRGGFLVIRPESVGGDIGATSQIGPVSPDSRFRDGLHSSAIAVSRDLRHLSRPSTEEWPVIWSLQLRSVLSETKAWCVCRIACWSLCHSHCWARSRCPPKALKLDFQPKANYLVGEPLFVILTVRNKTSETSWLEFQSPDLAKVLCDDFAVEVPAAEPAEEPWGCGFAGSCGGGLREVQSEVALGIYCIPLNVALICGVRGQVVSDRFHIYVMAIFQQLTGARSLARRKGGPARLCCSCPWH